MSMRKQSILLHCLSILSIILSFLLSFLNTSGYGIFHPETACLAFLGFAILICIFMLFYIFRLEWFFQSLLLLLVLDLIFGICGRIYLESKALLFIPPGVLLILSYVLPLAVLSSIVRLAGSKIAPISAVVWGFFFLSGLVLLPIQHRNLYQRVSSGESNGNGKPNILFIVLDEHIGIAGIPHDISGGNERREQLRNFYESQGFQVFDKAFSNYGWTELSLASVLNGEIVADINQRKNPLLAKNKLFSKLFREGFAINVYGNTYLEFCGSKEFRCAKQFIYSHNSPGYVSDLNISLKGKIWILVDSFVNAHKSYVLKLLETYKLQKTLSPVCTGPLAAPRILQELKQDLAQKKSGQFYFVHLLLPHYSYLYQPDCSILDWTLWSNPYIKTKRKEGIIERSKKYKAYLSQMECAQHMVQQLLDFLHESGTYDNMSIVVMGDHGSRLSLTRWDQSYTKMTAQDYVSWFSALAVVKPGTYNAGFAKKTIGSGRRPLAAIVADFFDMPLTSPARDFEQVYFPLQDGFASKEMKGLQ